jgi:hypothetical protein
VFNNYLKCPIEIRDTNLTTLFKYIPAPGFDKDVRLDMWYLFVSICDSIAGWMDGWMDG